MSRLRSTQPHSATCVPASGARSAPHACVRLGHTRRSGSSDSGDVGWLDAGVVVVVGLMRSGVAEAARIERRGRGA